MEWVADALVYQCVVCLGRKTLFELLAETGQVDRSRQMMNAGTKFSWLADSLASSQSVGMWKPYEPDRKGILESLGLSGIFGKAF